MHRRPKSASRKEIISRIKEIIEGDVRFTVRDIARKVGISLSTVHLILKKHLKVRKISVGWVPHLLTDEQKRQRVKVAEKLLQLFPKYDKKHFANFVTGDETWVHYFEPVRQVSNKICATKVSWLVVLGLTALSDSISVYIEPSPKEREKEERSIEESKNVQTTPTRTYCERSRPLPYCIQIVGRPGATKVSKRPIIAKRSLSAKVLYAIFSGEGVAMKVPVKRHHRK